MGARINRAVKNPDTGRHLGGPVPDLNAWMHSGSNHVICITLVALTLPGQFLQLFEALAAVGNQRQAAFNSP